MTSEITSTLRIRIGQEEAHYGGNLVEGARMLKLFGDIITEIAVITDGDEGLFVGYSNIEFTAPVYAGDFIEATGRVVEDRQHQPHGRVRGAQGDRIALRPDAECRRRAQGAGRGLPRHRHDGDPQGAQPQEPRRLKGDRPPARGAVPGIEWPRGSSMCLTSADTESGGTMSTVVVVTTHALSSEDAAELIDVAGGEAARCLVLRRGPRGTHVCLDGRSHDRLGARSRGRARVGARLRRRRSRNPAAVAQHDAEQVLDASVEALRRSARHRRGHRHAPPPARLDRRSRRPPRTPTRSS